MARTNREPAPWSLRTVRRAVAADARSGRIGTDPATLAATIRALRSERSIIHRVAAFDAAESER